MNKGKLDIRTALTGLVEDLLPRSKPAEDSGGLAEETSFREENISTCALSEHKYIFE